MRPLARKGVHALERGRGVPRLPQVVAMDVHGMRELQLVGGAREGIQDLPWRDGARPERIVQTAHVAPIPSTLPHCDAARVHDLDRVTPSRPQEPRHVIARPRALTGGELAKQIVVVAEQHEEAGIDDRCVVELRVRVPSGEGGHGRFHHRGIAEPGVAIAGRKGARHRPPGARARDRAILEPRRGQWIGRVLFGEQPPGVVHARPGDVRVHVHAAGHHHHAAGVQARSAHRHLCHDLVALDAHIAHDAVHPVRRVVHRAARDPESRGLGHVRSRSRSARTVTSAP